MEFYYQLFYKNITMILRKSRELKPIRIICMGDFIHFLKIIKYGYQDRERINLLFLKHYEKSVTKYYKQDTYNNVLHYSIEMLEILTEDKNHYISWFIQQTDWGKKNNETMVAGRFKKIKNEKDLYELIVWARFNQ